MQLQTAKSRIILTVFDALVTDDTENVYRTFKLSGVAFHLAPQIGHSISILLKACGTYFLTFRFSILSTDWQYGACDIERINANIAFSLKMHLKLHLWLTLTVS